MFLSGHGKTVFFEDEETNDDDGDDELRALASQIVKTAVDGALDICERE